MRLGFDQLEADVMKVRLFSACAAYLVAAPIVISAPSQAAAMAVTGPAPARAVSSGAVDYNGDGFDDLAIGGSTLPKGEDFYQGTLTVIYGSASGLRRTGNQYWRARDFPGGRDFDDFAAALAPGDFDGDGYTDLAVANRASGEDPKPWQGEVRIIYGSRSGLTAARSQVWSPDTPGVPGSPAIEEHEFAATLVAGNFGRGPQDDLAVGDPAYRNRRGAVTVLYGSAAGLTAGGSQLWWQGSPGVPGRAAAEEEFGSALAAANFSGGRYADLAIGVPLDRARKGQAGPGAVNVLYGSASGLRARGAQWWSQASRGIQGRAVREERFGASLAAGHFAGRAAADLAIGVRSDEAAREFGGAVNVIYGSARGLSARGNQIFSRRTRGLADRHKFDVFVGTTLTVGNFGNDPRRRAHDDLAIGATNAITRDGGSADRNVVEVLYGRAGGLSARHSQSWRWGTPGVQGRTTRIDGDGFGDSLTAADFGGSGHDDLAAGDSLYEVDENHYGAVGVLYGTSRGLTASGDQLWTVPALARSAPRFLENLR
jgi:hypothetical protein